MPTISKLIDALGVPVTNQPQLQNALTHRSYAHEHHDTVFEPNERLEFLGDAVLNMITAEYLYENYPAEPEGQLTAMRAVLVRAQTLAAFAREFDLGAFMKLGKGEERSGGREREALLADAFEAVVAAIYLDQGLETARAFLLPLLRRQVMQPDAPTSLQDDRSRLQELLQGQRNETPRYQTVSAEGPDHSRIFTVEVWAGEEQLGVGEGANKQAAAQAAAQAALAALDQDPPAAADDQPVT